MHAPVTVPLTELQAFLRWNLRRPSPPVTLATVAFPSKKKRKRKASQDKRREATVTAIAKILERGEPTRFAFEGACRAGVRATLCLKEWPWEKADAEAAAIVNAALRRVGAERPNWMQGQPEWTQYGYAPIERYFCEYCGDPLTEQTRVGSFGTPKRFCSAECRGLAASARDNKMRSLLTAAEYEAAVAAKAQYRKTLLADIAIESRSKECANCGKAFIAKRPDRTFCSRSCANIVNRAQATPPTVTGNCALCGTPFVAHKVGAMYCSKSCNAKASYARTKANRFLCEAAE